MKIIDVSMTLLENLNGIIAYDVYELIDQCNKFRLELFMVPSRICNLTLV